MAGFKNALCLDPLPDYYPPLTWRRMCHRHRGHPGRCRIVFRDGGVREWNTGDNESELTKEPYK